MFLFNTAFILLKFPSGTIVALTVLSVNNNNNREVADLDPVDGGEGKLGNDPAVEDGVEHRQQRSERKPCNTEQ